MRVYKFKDHNMANFEIVAREGGSIFRLPRLRSAGC